MSLELESVMEELSCTEIDEVGGGISYAAFMACVETCVEAWQGFYEGAKAGYYGKKK